MPPIAFGLAPQALLPDRGGRCSAAIQPWGFAMAAGRAAAEAPRAGRLRCAATQPAAPRPEAEPEPGPDTPAGPPPAFEISILERERAVQALLFRDRAAASGNAPLAGTTSPEDPAPWKQAAIWLRASYLAASASIG